MKKPWILLLIFFYIFLYFFINFKVRGFNNTEFIVKIISFKNGYFIAEINHRKIVITGDISKIKIGDIFRINGKFINFNKVNIYGYNEQHNFFSKNIFDKFYITSKSFLDNKSNIHLIITKFIFSGNLMYQKYTSLILLGIRNKDNQYIYDITKELSIVHLFVISGFHIGLLYLILFKILDKSYIKKSYISLIAILIIFIYLYILGFPVSSTRAYIFIILIQSNRYIFHKKYSNIFLMSIVSTLFILYNPYVVYSLSFILSFFATFMVLMANKLNIRNKTKKMIIVSMIVYFSMLPLTMSINNYFSIFGLIFSIILTPIISIYYVLTFFIFPFKTIASYAYWSLDFILKSFQNANYLIKINNIRFPVMFSYYIIYTLCILYEEKISILLISIKRKLLKK